MRRQRLPRHIREHAHPRLGRTLACTQPRRNGALPRHGPWRRIIRGLASKARRRLNATRQHHHAMSRQQHKRHNRNKSNMKNNIQETIATMACTTIEPTETPPTTMPTTSTTAHTTPTTTPSHHHHQQKQQQHHNERSNRQQPQRQRLRGRCQKLQ